MSGALQAGGALQGFLRRYGPDGRCKRCGEPLPDGRRFTHVACDAAALAEEAELAARVVPSEHAEDLHEVINRTLAAGRLSLADERFPADGWSREAFAAAQDWAPGDPGLWIHGTPGSGKSTILAGLALRLEADGVRTCLTSWQYFARAARATMLADQGRYHELLEGLGRVPVLLVDDLLVQAPTKWEQGLLYQVLDDRVNLGLPVVATSNHALDKARQVLHRVGVTAEDTEMAERVASRLKAAASSAALCVYPGDRRTGQYDQELAEQWAAAVGVRL